MVVAAGLVGLSISKTDELPGFLHTAVFRVYMEWLKKKFNLRSTVQSTVTLTTTLLRTE